MEYKVTLLDFRLYRRNALFGFCNIHISPLNWIFEGIKVFKRGDELWFGLLDREFEKDGEKNFVKIWKVPDNQDYQLLQRKLREALDEWIQNEEEREGQAPFEKIQMES